MEKPVKASRRGSHESFFDAAGNRREIANTSSGSAERPSVGSGSLMEVDFNQLRLATLQRYARHFEIKGLSTQPKHELAPFLKKHFERIPIENEISVFKEFIRRVRGNGDTAGPVTPPTPTWEGQKKRNLGIDIIKKKNNKQQQSKNQKKLTMMQRQTRAGQTSQAKTSDSQLEKERQNYGSFHSPFNQN